MTLATVSRYDSDRLSKQGGNAVVIGAGMAGPFTARILADEFNAVTVIDRDSLTGELTAHRDVPQGHASAVGRVARDEQVVSPRFVQFERRHQSSFARPQQFAT